MTPLYRTGALSPRKRAASRKEYDAIISLAFLAVAPLAAIVGFVLAVAQGYNLGPVLNSSQARGVIVGAIVASVPAIVGVVFGVRAIRTEQRGGKAGFLVNGLVLLVVWVVAVAALVM